MRISLQSTYFNTYRNIFKLLPAPFRKSFLKVQVLIIVTSFVDLFGLAVFVPILGAVADSSILEGSGYLAQVKNWVGVEDNNLFLLYLFMGGFAFFILRSIFIIFSQWIQNKFAFGMSEYIGVHTYKYYLNMNYLDFYKHDSNQVIRELNSNPKNFSQSLVKALLLINSELIAILIVVVGIALYDFKVLVLIICTILPFAVLFNYSVKKRMKRYGEELNELSPLLYRQSSRGIFGFIDVKLRQKEEAIISDYKSTVTSVNKISMMLNIFAIIPAKLFELVTVGGLMVIFFYGAFLADNPAIVLPLIALYAAAGYRIIPSLSKLIPSFLQLQQFGYLFRVYDKPLKYKPTSSNAVKTGSDHIAFNKSIELQNINFKFQPSEALFFDNLNIKIKKNEIVGIIGKSGSGKTTLVKLLAGFVKMNSGNILVDDLAVNEENKVLWMKKISYVQQSPYIEPGSLASNIAFLEEVVDETRLLNAIKMASLEDLVGDMSPHDFNIEENGKNLSGGQRQRVIIARALYHESEIVILDEATSALDNETENEINETIAGLVNSGLTIVIIAHRYSTLKHTNRILEMANGSIINECQYADLEQ